MNRRLIPFLLPLLVVAACTNDPALLRLEPGMTITSNAILAPDSLFMPADWDPKEPLIRIEGSHIAIDFNGAVLIGKDDPARPDLFSGTAIYVAPGSDLQLFQPRAHGFKIGLRADSCLNLHLLDADFSYNYRQHLKSTREAEDLDDWMSYHDNESDQWLRYGAAVYLSNCDSAVVKGLRVTGGQNGLMLNRCNDGTFYNNDIRFNSGIGIGLYRSSRNRIMHNRLDWNVRGYSHGIYARGQDSAGLLVYEQSSENIFAYNSATHSGDGFFLWAGNETMESGEGGCNENLVLANDFSHAPANGIEVTFSSGNTFVRNKLEDCRYGIWGGYSYQTRVLGNIIGANEYGIAIEHGHANAIQQNIFADNAVSVQLWERSSQPESWPFAQIRDVRSADYFIENNLFLNESLLFDIRDTEGLHIHHNAAWSYGIVADRSFWTGTPDFRENRLSHKKGIPLNSVYMEENEFLYEKPDSSNWQAQLPPVPEPPMEEGQLAYLPEDHLRGRAYILVDEWGPYDFRSPSIWLREVDENTYTFLLLGPPTGNWRTVDGNGWTSINPKTGTFPATLVARRTPDADSLRLDLEYIGEAFINRFGQEVSRGSLVPFGWEGG